MSEIFAEVAVFAALEKTLLYRVPEEHRDAIRVGSRVLAPVGRRRAGGLVMALKDSRGEVPDDLELRDISKILDPVPLLTPELIDLCRWISRYYFYPIGEAVLTALPLGPQERESFGKPKTSKSVRLVCAPPDAALQKSSKLASLVALLQESGAILSAKEIRDRIPNADYWLRKLGGLGCIKIEDVEEDIPEFRCAQDLLPETPFKLTSDQERVFDAILPAIQNPVFAPFVLHGVTGSGKTEIYLRLVEAVLAQGRGSLVLVPEIALSTQLEALFRQRFGDCLAIWHSALPPKMRSRQWLDILSGERRIVLGARSAVFTPIEKLGLVIVDEEHDSSYKQEDRLRYHARDVAMVRAKMSGIPVVLGSATPSLQTVFNFRRGRYTELVLPSRVMNRPLPELDVIDMRKQGGRGRIFSYELEEALKKTLESGNQALLFLNRRGFSKFFLCHVCGDALQCPNCTITLTYHQKENRLRCHFCGWDADLPKKCPVCDQEALFAYGFGTERLEKETKRLFPAARLIRMDRDTMKGPDDLLDALNAMRRGRGDVLIGTQMIAKGHDFPGITLVGVINADTGLQVPDFRAGETMVQLLLQVAGRAGRGEEPGRVILQTFNPFHFTIDSVLRMDYAGFCEKELHSREMLKYPPYTRLLRFLVTANSEDEAREAAFGLSDLCRAEAARLKESGKHAALIGPSAAPHLKLKNRFRWHLFIKTWDNSTMQSFAEAVLGAWKADPRLRRAQVSVDRDPVSNL